MDVFQFCSVAGAGVLRHRDRRWHHPESACDNGISHRRLRSVCKLGACSLQRRQVGHCMRVPAFCIADVREAGSPVGNEPACILVCSAGTRSISLLVLW